ncbi:ribonuclease Z [Thaumasiovibrio subtropicus]|uniref:ribonuclease Z n=1 Tax=Thaumasiovibrio subtropicus TaxID=1891207 RepID=UPI000B355AC7|nr:ribonuclease Z [Thaumasiovibrio subtropicus]
MELLFLGTSSGAPTKERNVSAIALCESQGKDWYLIDCGEGTQHQLLRTNLSVNALRGIFITHVHGDHCYGLPGLLASAAMNGRTSPLTIIAPQGVQAWFDAIQTHTLLHLPYEVSFVTCEELPHRMFGQFEVTVSELSHRVPSYAFAFTERDQGAQLDTQKLKAKGIPAGPIWGDLQRGIDVEYQGITLHSREFLQRNLPPRKVVICGDNDKPALLDAVIEHCHLLVHEATYTHEIAKKVGAHVGHSSAEMIAKYAHSRQLPALCLTHFSARYQSNINRSPSINDIENEARSFYDASLFLAEDFARYVIDRQGAVQRAD